MELYKPPLIEKKRSDFFAQDKIHNELEEFELNYFFNGKRLGAKNTGNIDLNVVSWIVDSKENFFIRYCTFSGQKHAWKEKITDQLRQLMSDVGVSGGIIKSHLRFFEVANEKYLNTEEFEETFLKLKRKMEKE